MTRVSLIMAHLVCSSRCFVFFVFSSSLFMCEDGLCTFEAPSIAWPPPMALCQYCGSARHRQ